jgi:chromosome segregation ATPase
MEQRSLFRKCVYAAQLGRKHLDELANVVRHSHPETGNVRQHLTEVRGAVTEMLEDHHRFILDLTEDQWNAAKSSITELEQQRATINAQLEGIDAELKMPAPDSQILSRYAKKTGRLLRQWQEQHRKMGAALGMKDM